MYTTVRLDEEGNGIYRITDGEDWTYPASGFGTGIVAGREVMCLTPEVQNLCHSTGYEPGLHDMRLLHARFDTTLAPPSSGPVQAT